MILFSLELGAKAQLYINVAIESSFDRLSEASNIGKDEFLRVARELVKNFPSCNVFEDK